jgi:hypothetical protein
MYSNVTYKSVQTRVYPFKFKFSTRSTGTPATLDNQILCAIPMVTCLDVNSDIPLTLETVEDFSRYTVRGGKSFQLHAAGKEFHRSYPDLDRVCMQRYGKMLFNTNTKYSSRERLTNSPSI